MAEETQGAFSWSGAKEWVGQVGDLAKDVIGTWRDVVGVSDGQPSESTASVPEAPKPGSYDLNFSLGDAFIMPNWYLWALGAGLLALALYLKKRR